MESDSGGKRPRLQPQSLPVSARLAVQPPLTATATAAAALPADASAATVAAPGGGGAGSKPDSAAAGREGGCAVAIVRDN